MTQPTTPTGQPAPPGDAKCSLCGGAAFNDGFGVECEAYEKLNGGASQGGTTNG